MRDFLFLRTQNDEAETRKIFSSLPLNCTFVPLFEVHFTPRSKNLDFSPYDVLCATSRHGVLALHTFGAPKNFPLFVVGHASALYAQNLGFENVKKTFEGSVLNLAQHMKTCLAPNAQIFYAHGKEVRHDLADLLKEHFTVTSWQAYSLSLDTTQTVRVHKILQQSLWGLAALSLAQARFLHSCPWSSACKKPRIFSLSQAITEELHSLDARVYTAPFPRLDALVAQVEKALAKK